MNSIKILKPIINLSSTNKIIIDSVRKFCRTDLMNTLSNQNKDYRSLYKKFGNLGILGPTINDYNCAGLNYTMYGLIAKEIEYIDSGFRSMYSVQSSLVMNPIDKYGSKEVKDQYLENLASGDLIGCFGLTEPHSGSDASNMKTIAKKKGDDYILSGSKTWITNSPIADVFIIWAKYDNSINGFVLDRSMDGISTSEIKDKMSLHNSVTGQIFMDEVRVPESHKLDVVGMKGPLTCLNSARLGISFGVLGAAESCIDISLDYASERELFGELLIKKQLFQSKIVDMVCEYNLGLLASLEVAKNIDEDKYNPEMISLIKRNNCQKSLDISRKARDILGGNGITSSYNVFRHMINLETVNTYEGTSDIHSLILGKYLTGVSSF